MSTATTAEIISDSGVVFTDNAARKVHELIMEEGNPNLKLRVFITGGGCSGFQYGFSFEETINEDDTVIEKNIAGATIGRATTTTGESVDTEGSDGGTDGGDSSGGGSSAGKVQLLVDPMSYQYLSGAEIDYVEDIEGERFVIRNPNAQTTCGCGSSFSV